MKSFGFYLSLILACAALQEVALRGVEGRDNGNEKKIEKLRDKHVKQEIRKHEQEDKADIKEHAQEAKEKEKLRNKRNKETIKERS